MTSNTRIDKTLTDVLILAAAVWKYMSPVPLQDPSYTHTHTLNPCLGPGGCAICFYQSGAVRGQTRAAVKTLSPSSRIARCDGNERSRGNGPQPGRLAPWLIRAILAPFRTCLFPFLSSSLTFSPSLSEENALLISSLLLSNPPIRSTFFFCRSVLYIFPLVTGPGEGSRVKNGRCHVWNGVTAIKYRCFLNGTKEWAVRSGGLAGGWNVCFQSYLLCGRVSMSDLLCVCSSVCGCVYACMSACPTHSL